VPDRYNGTYKREPAAHTASSGISSQKYMLIKNLLVCMDFSKFSGYFFRKNLAECCMPAKMIFTTIFLVFFLVSVGWTQQRESTDVRLTRIEESIKALAQRMEDLNKATNQRMEDLNKATIQRMEDLNKAINQRIDDTNQRIDVTNQRFESGFNMLATMLAAVIALNAVMLGVAFWIARQDRPIGKKHYDKLVRQDREFVGQFDTLTTQQESQDIKQDELAGMVRQQLNDRDRRIDELADKINKLESEVAVLKSPAT
jgi:uncharacterized protein YoxC